LKFSEISGYRNSFLPLINCTVEVPGGVAALGQPDTGYAMRLVMHLRLKVRLFMLVWLGGVSFACLTVGISSPGQAILIPFLMLGMGILLIAAAFLV
jgi:hypothetical protein